MRQELKRICNRESLSVSAAVGGGNGIIYHTLAVSLNTALLSSVLLKRSPRTLFWGLHLLPHKPSHPGFSSYLMARIMLRRVRWEMEGGQSDTSCGSDE